MSGRGLHHALGALVLVAWAVAMGRLGKSELAAKAIRPDKTVGELLADGETRAYAVYQCDPATPGSPARGGSGPPGASCAKIGFALSRRIRQGDGWLFADQEVYRLVVQESRHEVRLETAAFIGNDFGLRSFRTMLSDGPTVLSASGRLEGGALLLSFENAGRRSEDRIPVEGPILLPAMSRAWVAARNPSPGSSWRVPVFNPFSRQVELEDIVVEDRESVDGVGALRLEEILRGSIRTTAWVDARGETVRERAGLLRMEQEPRERALSFGEGEAPPDLIRVVAVPVQGDIPGQMAAGRMRLLLSGIVPEEFPLLSGGRQHLDGSTVTVEQGRLGSGRLPYPAKDLAPWLGPEPLVQSTDGEIVAVARQAVGDAPDAATAARRLNQWVFENLRKETSLGIPSAVEVLKDRFGDCNEHTTLYVALARAVGLPARMAVGLVWANARGGGPGFYYHAWPEVFLGPPGSAFPDPEKAAGWVPVDPTLGQFPADVGHLRFIVGGLDRQVDLLKLIGKIEVRALSPTARAGETR